MATKKKPEKSKSEYSSLRERHEVLSIAFWEYSKIQNAIQKSQDSFNNWIMACIVMLALSQFFALRRIIFLESKVLTP